MKFTRVKRLMDAYDKSEIKIETKFLLFPVEIAGEMRWLETATIMYQVQILDGVFDRYYDWQPIKFIDK
jgi:hypothetical protein